MVVPEEGLIFSGALFYVLIPTQRTFNYMEVLHSTAVLQKWMEAGFHTPSLPHLLGKVASNSEDQIKVP